MSHVIMYFLFILNIVWLQNFVRSDQEGIELLNTLLTNYDKTVRPNYGGENVKVGITLFITNVDAISEENMELSIHMYFRQKWTDSRLAYSSSDKSLNLSGVYADKFWTPDTFFPEEKQYLPHTLTDSNSFIRLKPNGELNMSTKRSITIACHMDLSYFPMDTQECKLSIESYAFINEEVLYFWLRGKNESADIYSGIHLTNFYISEFYISNLTMEFSTGIYSILQVHIIFTRIISAYFFHVYIPAALIVIISYMSLWINISYFLIRSILGMTSTIAMILIVYNPYSSPTKSAYTKSLDIYIGGCLFLVFATVIEYGIVTYLHQRKRINNEGTQAIIQYSSSAVNSSITMEQQETLIMDDENKRLMTIIDRIEYFSRIGFLVFFIGFVILYWIIGKSLAKNSNSRQ